ncbi:hypothetical protein D3C80_1975290 [compost metagenome]
MADIDQNNMGSLFVITSYHVIGKERFPAAGWPQYKLIPIGTNSSFYRLVTNVYMNRFSSEAISQANPYRTKGRMIPCLHI